MAFDYSELRKKIKEVCGTQDAFALRLGIGRVSLSQRLNNVLEFDQDDMAKSCNVLGLEITEIPLYFFNPEVQENEQQ